MAELVDHLPAALERVRRASGRPDARAGELPAKLCGRQQQWRLVVEELAAAVAGGESQRQPRPGPGFRLTGPRKRTRGNLSHLQALYDAGQLPSTLRSAYVYGLALAGRAGEAAAALAQLSAAERSAAAFQALQELSMRGPGPELVAFYQAALAGHLGPLTAAQLAMQ
jgi:hypothetical protein